MKLNLFFVLMFSLFFSQDGNAMTQARIDYTPQALERLNRARQEAETRRIENEQRIERQRQEENQSRINQQITQQFQSLISSITRDLDSCVTNITEGRTTDAISIYERAQETLSEAQAFARSHGMEGNTELIQLQERHSNLYPSMSPVYVNEKIRLTSGCIRVYRMAMDRAEEKWQGFQAAMNENNPRDAGICLDCYKASTQQYRPGPNGYRGDRGMYGCLNDSLTRDQPIMLERIQHMTAEIDRLLEQAAANRVSQDPQVIATQAEIDAQNAARVQRNAVRYSLRAQEAAARDPENTRLRAARDQAVEREREAQAALDQALAHAQAMRIEARIAERDEHIRAIIEDWQDRVDEELRVHRAGIRTVFPRTGLPVPEYFQQ